METRQEALSPIVFRQGKKVYLRPILKEDLELLVRWINDPEVTQFLKVVMPMSPEEEWEWFEGLRKRKPRDVVFGIALTKTNELIGNTGLHRIDSVNRTATTGTLIGRKDLWGQGYGTEAKMLLLDYAFNTLNLRKICSQVHSSNPRSQRCQEKCGYKVEGRFKDHIFRNGEYVDLVQLAVFRDDFLPLWERYQLDLQS